ncbi:MAG: TIM barrel protein [Thermofilaceae archaeon]|nr:TIM barrel protein [Thermofilaceae archaeon]MCX8181326.1 TIM barrel protein [Thermofilaceae archaeon]MDW8003569.1 sugar phosphate isomerase/epimerase family protein [Thermofilaceae archaeon]
MKITKSLLSKLETEYAGYLEGERLNRFFEEFEIKFAAGHWAAGDFLDRFATRGYWPELSSDIKAQIERVAKAGIKGIEFHNDLFLDENLRIVEDRITEVKGLLEKHKLKATTMNVNMFTDPRWKLGSVTHPDAKVREKALEVLLQAADIAKAVGCEAFSFWPGQDGWDYNFEVNYGKQFEWFMEACRQAAKRAKETGLRFGIEAKLKEPKEGNMVIPTTHVAGWIAYTINRELGGNYMGVTIDYGHEQMYAVEPAYTVYALNKMGVPIANFHVNTAKLHSNDEDRVFGTGDIWRFVDYLYAAIDTGYEGWFGEDQFTYRMDPVKAMALSKEIFGNLMKKALLIYAKKDALEEARSKGDQAEILNVVKRIILIG